MAIKLKITADEYAKLSKDLQGAYKAVDGAYVVDGEVVDGLEVANVTNMRKALESERGFRKTAEEKLATYGDMDPTKVKADLDELKKLRESGNTDEKTTSRIKTLERELTEKHQKELGERDTKIKTLESENEDHIFTNVATAAVTQHKGRPKLLLDEIRRNTKIVVGPDGKRVAKIIDPKTGHERITQRSGASGDMTIEEFVESLKKHDDYACAFEGSGASGTGAGGSGNRGNNGGGGKIDPSLPPSERLRLAHEAGTTK